MISILFAMFEAWASSVARWGFGPDHQSRDRAQKNQVAEDSYLSAPEIEQGSAICGCFSIMCMVAAIVTGIWYIGFSWAFMLVALAVAAVRALGIAIVILKLSKDTAHPPKLFDFAMYETIGLTALFTLWFFVGGLVMLILRI